MDDSLIAIIVRLKGLYSVILRLLLNVKELEEAKPKQNGCDKKLLHVVHFLIDIHGKEHKITSLQMHKSLDNLYRGYYRNGEKLRDG